MKTEPANTTATPNNLAPDSAKFVSLLALAAGAVAIPQTSEADVILTDMSGSPINIGFLASPQFVISNLPGSARLGFQFGDSHSLTSESRWILAGQANTNAVYVKLRTNALLAVHAPAGVKWDSAGAGERPVATIASAYYLSHRPNNFSHEFLLFKFQDSTQGNAVRYGWVDVSLSNGNLNSTDGPQLTIWSYAFDTSGAQLAAGSVPEPTSVSLLALGALALGARGVRSWKRSRPQ
jgi:hypothetical protein